MDTFRDMIMQYRDVQNILLFFAAIGALTLLFLLVKLIWLICSGGIKLETTITDRRQYRKIREQEREIESLKNHIERLQSFSSEIDEIKEKLEQK